MLITRVVKCRIERNSIIVREVALVHCWHGPVDFTTRSAALSSWIQTTLGKACVNSLEPAGVFT